MLNRKLSLLTGTDSLAYLFAFDETYSGCTYFGSGAKEQTPHKKAVGAYTITWAAHPMGVSTIGSLC